MKAKLIKKIERLLVSELHCLNNKDEIEGYLKTKAAQIAELWEEENTIILTEIDITKHLLGEFEAPTHDELGMEYSLAGRMRAVLRGEKSERRR